MPYDESWAVVIGINDYLHVPKLQFAVNDATAIRNLLINKFGFESQNVFALYDREATKNKILTLLGDELPFKLGENDRLFIYFAGHGETRNKMGYLLPVDCKMGRYRSMAISMNELKDILKEIKCKHVYLVLDACYSGMFFTTRALSITEAHPRYLYEITRRRARQALTAGGKEPVSDSGFNDHSVFTGYVLKALESGIADYNGDGILAASEIASYVLPQVANLAQQTPEYGQLPGSEGGEFVFFLKDQAGTLQKSGAAERLQEKRQIVIVSRPPTKDKTQIIDPKVKILEKNAQKIVLRVKGDPPPKSISILGKKATALKNNRKRAQKFLKKVLKGKYLDDSRLEIDTVEYDENITAIVTYIYYF